MSPADPKWTVVIPVKSPAMAKSRLRNEREMGANLPEISALATAFMCDVVDAAQTAGNVRRTIVISPDELVAFHVEPLAEFIQQNSASTNNSADDPNTLNAAIAQAVAFIELTDQNASIAVVAGDLAALRSETLDDVLRCASGAGQACFVRDMAGSGTTILALPSGQRITPSFGGESANRHQSAGALDITANIASDARLDVDTAADLGAAAVQGLGSHTAGALSRPTEV